MGFALELMMLARGDSLATVIGSACGYCSAGLVWQRALHELLQELPTERSRRRVLQHFLRLFSAAKLHGSQWRVVDASGYVGRTNVVAPEVLESFDSETGEVLHRETERTVFVAHVPGRSAGALSAREGRSPRQLHRYRRWLRGADRETPRGKSTSRGVMGSRQPRFDASDAVLPKTEGACWAYAQHWLLLPPSPEMLSRWGARSASSASKRPPLRLGSAELPRLPSEPEQLAALLQEARNRSTN